MIQENQVLIHRRGQGGELICIQCPIGCRLTVTKAEDGEIVVEGNQCVNGERYAKEELSDPRRIVTGTCAVLNGEVPRLPVRSVAGVPVDEVPRFLHAMYDLRPHAPVACGDLLAENVGDTGIALVATMSVGGGQVSESA